MNRKKKLWILLAVAALLLADFLYWSVPFSFGKMLPEETWTEARLVYYDDHLLSRETVIADEAMLEQILTAAEETTVTHRPRFRTISQSYFELFLLCEEGAPCVITLLANGDVAVTPEMDSDCQKFCDGAEELFAALAGFWSESF